LFSGLFAFLVPGASPFSGPGTFLFPHPAANSQPGPSKALPQSFPNVAPACRYHDNSEDYLSVIHKFKPQPDVREADAKCSLSLNIVYRRIDELKPDPANPRRHTKQQI